jgi:hypothetical protein
MVRFALALLAIMFTHGQLAQAAAQADILDPFPPMTRPTIKATPERIQPTMQVPAKSRLENVMGPAAGPKSLGKFDDWTAATHVEAGQTVCYAFTRVRSSAPGLPGRGALVLTVAERASGRDAVAIETGFSYLANSLIMTVDQAGFEFYAAGRNAFAMDGKAAVSAFGKGSLAIARSPGSEEVMGTFSLTGFGAAYAVIVKACPAK